MSRRSRQGSSKPAPIRTLLFGGAPFLLMLYIGLCFLLPTIVWAGGGGTHGTLTATGETCGRHHACSWNGDFTGASGTPVARDVSVTNETAKPLHQGERLPAIYATSGLFLFPHRVSGVAFLGPRSLGDIFSTDVLARSPSPRSAPSGSWA